MKKKGVWEYVKFIKLSIFIILIVSAIISTTVYFNKVSNFHKEKQRIVSLIEDIQLEKDYIKPESLIARDIEEVVKKAKSQEFLAKGIFDVVQKRGDLAPQFSLLSAYDKDEFADTLDMVEQKWSSLPKDDYYDEVGIFLLYANSEISRSSEAESIFKNLAEHCQNSNINPDFYKYEMMSIIDLRASKKEFWAPREDLSLVYAAKLAENMYRKQNKQDKVEEVIDIITTNYSDTAGAKFTKASYEFEKAERKYGTSQAVSNEDRERLLNNLQNAREEMDKLLKK